MLASPVYPRNLSLPLNARKRMRIHETAPQSALPSQGAKTHAF